MKCFAGNLTVDVFKAHHARMRQEIASLSAEKMDKTDRDAWVDYYVSQYEIDCLTIYPEDMQLELDEKTLQEYNHWSKHAQWYCKIQNKDDERIMHVTVKVFDLHA